MMYPIFFAKDGINAGFHRRTDVLIRLHSSLKILETDNSPVAFWIQTVKCRIDTDESFDGDSISQ